MCVAFTTLVFFWFAQAMQGYTGAPLALAVLVLVLLAPILQPQLIVFAVVRFAARRLPFFWRAAGGAAIYVAAEWMLPKLFADTIGHGLFASVWMRQAADLAGAPGLTFVLVLGNECLWKFAKSTAARRRGEKLAKAPLAVLLGLIVGLCIYGEIRLHQLEPETGGDAITVAAVQADLSHYGDLASRMSTFDAVRLILDAHFDLSGGALERGRLDLLVWPETVYPTTFGAPKSEAGADYDREIAAFVARSETPLLFGAYDVEGEREFNAAFLLQPGQQLLFDTYRKARLFPFTERVPFLFDNAAVRAWLPWMGTWQEGSGTTTLTLDRRDGGAVKMAPLICYDAVDPSLAIAAVRDGAELIVAISNDSWFAEGTGPRLHLIVSAFRSLETRRPQVRATTTGVSAMISPTGDLLSLLDVHEKGVLVARLAPVRGAETLMLRWGDWFGPFSFCLGVALLGLGSILHRNASDRHRASDLETLPGRW